MASGTQNLSPATLNKTKNKKITVNGGGGGNYSVIHLLNNVVVIFVQTLIQK